MGKKSRSKHAAGTSSASAAASTSGAIGTAPTGTSSLGTSAVERLGSDADTSIRLGELLDSIRCQAVLQRLKGSGYSENVAQVRLPGSAYRDCSLHPQERWACLLAATQPQQGRAGRGEAAVALNSMAHARR